MCSSSTIFPFLRLSISCCWDPTMRQPHSNCATLLFARYYACACSAERLQKAYGHSSHWNTAFSESILKKMMMMMMMMTGRSVDMTVSIAKKLRAAQPGNLRSISGRRVLLFATVSKPALRPTPPPNQRISVYQ
jgi:hypothetical protein